MEQSEHLHLTWTMNPSCLLYCSRTGPQFDRATDMVQRMTLAEKIASLSNNMPAIKGLGTHFYGWRLEPSTGVSLHVANFSFNPAQIGTTKFAYPATTAISSNRSLWHAMGAQIGREARGLVNIFEEYSTYWAPVIKLGAVGSPHACNLHTTPYRTTAPYMHMHHTHHTATSYHLPLHITYAPQSQITTQHHTIPPYLPQRHTTQHTCTPYYNIRHHHHYHHHIIIIIITPHSPAAALGAQSRDSARTHGGLSARHPVHTRMQHSPDDPRYLQASACCKHNVLGSMESMRTGAVNSNEDWLDTHMEPFQESVEEGKVSGLTCSYNQRSEWGAPLANKWLLEDTARVEWGFDGHVTSDCDAIGDPAMHGYAPDPAHAVADALKALTGRSRCAVT